MMWHPMLPLTLLLLLVVSMSRGEAAEPWPRHTIDNSSRGADGVKLGDVNGDGQPDIATGWEEGGLVRLYLHPGRELARLPWPRVSVGQVASPEDASFVDLDHDAAVDVVSCCEGNTRSVFVHWAPRQADRLLQEEAWTTKAFPQLQNRQQWMFCLPIDADGRRTIDLVVGSKGRGGSVTLLLAPDQPRQLARWSVQPLRPAGWIMSLIGSDLDRDGDTDVLLSDRRGAKRGVYWLENPGHEAIAAGAPWPEHTVGVTETEVMFLALADLDADGSSEVVAMTQDAAFQVIRRDEGRWRSETVALPRAFRRGKGVAASDINRDGRPDLVMTSEDGLVAWVQWHGAPHARRWQVHDISGGVGRKFDRVELFDIDGDGDDDILTCEEAKNLGVVWYENPLLNN